jgi:hypothetical protein
MNTMKALVFIFLLHFGTAWATVQEDETQMAGLVFCLKVYSESQNSIYEKEASTLLSLFATSMQEVDKKYSKRDGVKLVTEATTRSEGKAINSESLPMCRTYVASLSKFYRVYRRVITID